MRALTAFSLVDRVGISTHQPITSSDIADCEFFISAVLGLQDERGTIFLKVTMKLAAIVRRALNEGGPKTLVSRSIRKLFSPLACAGTLVFAEVDLTKPIREVPPISGIEPREAFVGDARLFDDSGLFLERISGGDRCFLAVESATGRLTNYRWITTSPTHIPELNRYLVPEASTVYAYDLVTLPQFRRRGIDSYARYFTYTFLQRSGVTKIYAYIHGDNQPSLKSASHFNRQLGRIAYVQFRGCEPFMFGKGNQKLPALLKLQDVSQATHTVLGDRLTRIRSNGI
jgi:hypothetical protein